MPNSFDTVADKKRGYNKSQVDDFFDRAREAYDSDAEAVTSQNVREQAFELEKGGYNIDHVDAALERLEDALSLREREEHIRLEGAEAWRDQARDKALTVAERLGRPKGKRFKRAGFMRIGYSRKQVDELADRIVAHFREAADLEIQDVRNAVFVRQGNGYNENQVDAVLDRVVEIMLAVQ